MTITECRVLIDSVAAQLMNYETCLGLATVGSWTRGQFDEYSDLDLVIVVADTSWLDFCRRRRGICEALLSPLACFTEEPNEVSCLVGDPLGKVDIIVDSAAEFTNRSEHPTVLWERNGTLAEILAGRSPNFGAHRYPMPNRQMVEDRFWIWMYYCASRLGRGEIYEAIKAIEFCRSEILVNMAQLAEGSLPFGVRRLEFRQPEISREFECTVVAYDAAACIRAVFEMIKIYRRIRSDAGLEGINIHSEAEKAATLYCDFVRAQLVNRRNGGGISL